MILVSYGRTDGDATRADAGTEHVYYKTERVEVIPHLVKGPVPRQSVEFVGGDQAQLTDSERERDRARTARERRGTGWSESLSERGRD